MAIARDPRRVETVEIHRVLLIEDSDGDARLVELRLLESETKYDIHRVKYLEEGLAALGERDFELILLDLSLPDGTGLDSFQRIRGACPRTPIIVLTGLEDESIAAKAARMGAEDYLVKSELSAEQLSRSLRYAVERNRAAHELLIHKGALEATATGVLLFTTGSRRRMNAILHCNAAAESMTGYRGAELIGRDLLRFLAARTGTLHSELEQAIKSGIPGRAVSRFNKPAGETIWLELTVNPIDEGGREGVHWVCALNDITERELTLEKIRESQRLEAVGQLAGGIAHDFNNLLTVVLGDAELLQSQLSEAGHLERLTRIQAAAERASRLTQQLLAFSRQQPLELVLLDVNEVIRDLEGMIRRLLNERIELSCSATEPGCHISADRGQIEQMILNLVVNGSDAMPEGGRLDISVEHQRLTGLETDVVLGAGDYVRLAIQDTGEGMDELTREKAFEPFFTTKGVGRGTGLGLATVYGITRQLGGQVVVNSALAKGSRFEIYLPAQAPPPLEDGASLARSVEEPAVEQRTILVVEDDDGVRSMATDMLVAQGYQVIPKSRPVDALDWAKDERSSVDLLLTDVVMPDMSGPELATKLLRARPEMKVLMMTGYADDVLGDSERRHQRVIQKPFSLERLSTAIRQALASA